MSLAPVPPSRAVPHLQQRPALSPAPSSASVPVATNSIANRAGSASSSLYQNCLSIRERLSRVSGFAERFFAESPSATDPVSQVTSIFRLGSSLCYLFNLLGTSKQLEVNPECSRDNLKACKISAAHFIMGCRAEGIWKEGDDNEGFTITMLYEQDTNGTVKVSAAVPSLCARLRHAFLSSLPHLFITRFKFPWSVSFLR
jgi:cell division control protein 24